MKLIASRFVMSSASIGLLGACALALQGGCSLGKPHGTAADSGAPVGSEPAKLLGFTPSNITLAGMDLSKIEDEDLSGECDLGTEPTVTAGSSCFQNAAEAVVKQSDGTKVHVFVVKSLRVEATAHLTVNRPSGGLPLAIVSLGDMTILGPVDVRAIGDTAYAGGFQSTQLGKKGAGPGGGPGATGTAVTTQGAGAGGGSYCGRGGPGALETKATGKAGPATAPYGSAEIIPLVGGSSGGAGSFGAGAGGGALQLVAGGKFSLGAGSYINVGGGGGQPAVSSNWGDNSSGGGSGGSILIEAPTVTIAGTLAANGGGGGGVSSNGADASGNALAAAGGTPVGAAAGGAGGAGAHIDGTTPAPTAPGPVGGGGGGVGRIRINTSNGAAGLAAATLSPAATTSCMTQGKLKS